MALVPHSIRGVDCAANRTVKEALLIRRQEYGYIGLGQAFLSLDANPSDLHFLLLFVDVKNDGSVPGFFELVESLANLVLVEALFEGDERIY